MDSDLEALIKAKGIVLSPANIKVGRGGVHRGGAGGDWKGRGYVGIWD